MDKNIDAAGNFDNLQTVEEEFLGEPGGGKKEPGSRTPRKANLIEALFTFGFLIVVMSVSIIKFKLDPHIPMFVGVIAAAVMGLWLGYKWESLENAMIKGISQAMQSIIILAIIGMLIGVWIVSGVVPSMILYGLKLLSPQLFLPAAVLICSITSLATGTSWGTAGTMGVALMGIAVGLDIPLPLAAGAVISGAYFGDKMSPLSDTTNLAPAMAGTDVFTHVKAMIPTTVVAYLAALGLFAYMGMGYGGTETSLESIKLIQDGILSQFKVSPVLLIPPALVIVLVAMKMPAIPGIVIGLLTAAFLAPIYQGASLGDILKCAHYGYVSETGVEVIDTLFTKGGLEGMLFSISLTIIAMMFGGIMEETGQLETIVNAVLFRLKSYAGLIVSTEVTCLFSNITMPEQYISIVIPGRMYAQSYRERGLHPSQLSSTLEGMGTVSGALIPWNTCGAFMSNALGVPTALYFKYCFFNLFMPLVVAVFAFLKFNVRYMTEEEKARLAETGRC